MAFKHGRLAEITYNTKALSAFCDTADIDIGGDTADTTTFLAAWKTAIPGLLGGTFAISGGYDPTVTTGPASVITTTLGTVVPIIFYPAGNIAGQGTSHTFSAICTAYKESSKVSDNVLFSATVLITGVDTIAQL